MKTIIYFAGYAGHFSKKYEILKEYFNGINVVQFNQTYHFQDDTEYINGLIKKYEADDIIFIASSLGAIQAIFSAFKYNKHLILINPSYFPEITLKEYLSDIELNELFKFKNEINELMNKNKPIIDLFVSLDDERINAENRKKFMDIFDKYINYRDISEIGKHEYNIISEKLIKFRAFIYSNDLSYEDFFQLL